MADEHQRLMMYFASTLTIEQAGSLRSDTAGSRDARLAALVNRQARFVFQVAYAVLRNREDAEDMVQELFLKLCRSNAWERMNDERAFLARSTWRLAVARLPKRVPQELDANTAARQPNPEEAAIASDWNGTIHRMIDALPEELRQVLALSAIAGLRSPEIGKIIGVSEGTVRTRLMRGRGLLKSKIAAAAARESGRYRGN